MFDQCNIFMSVKNQGTILAPIKNKPRCVHSPAFWWFLFVKDFYFFPRSLLKSRSHLFSSNLFLLFHHTRGRFGPLFLWTVTVFMLPRVFVFSADTNPPLLRGNAPCWCVSRCHLVSPGHTPRRSSVQDSGLRSQTPSIFNAASLLRVISFPPENQRPSLPLSLSLSVFFLFWGLRRSQNAGA